MAGLGAGCWSGVEASWEEEAGGKRAGLAVLEAVSGSRAFRDNQRLGPAAYAHAATGSRTGHSDSLEAVVIAAVGGVDVQRK